MRNLEENVLVGGQITAEDVGSLAKHGMKTIICNRPDGEAPGQPSSAVIEAAAKEHGLTFISLPMTGLTPDLIDASIKAYADSPRPIAAFCASGTRSTVLWCFAAVKELGVDAVLESAANAGYALEQFRQPLTAMAEKT